MRIRKNGKVINLTESDLRRIVKMAINEDKNRRRLMSLSPLLSESVSVQEMLGSLTASQMKELQKIKSVLDGVGSRIEECYNLNDYPILYELCQSSLCLVIIACIIAGTEGLGALAIAGISWATGCVLEDVKEMQSIIYDEKHIKRSDMKKEVKKLMRCIGQDISSVAKNLTDIFSDLF